MPQSQPAYRFSDFNEACGQDDKVMVYGPAQDDARTYFNLKNQQAIRDFIFSGGLEDLKHTHTDILRMMNPDPKTKIMEDEYSFRTGSKHGYLAFFYNKKTDKWIIKSFKKNWDEPMPSPFILKRSGFTRRLIYDINQSEGKNE